MSQPSVQQDNVHEEYDNKKRSEIYMEGFKEGYNESNNDFKKREYHAGYKQGYRDACVDSYWYNGVMVGILSAIGGVLMYVMSKKSKLIQF